jgi:hypothetical protein
LSASLTALSLKADYGLSEGCFNGWMQFMGNAFPDNNCMPKFFYQARKSISQLGLASLKIECCMNGCKFALCFYIFHLCKHFTPNLSVENTTLEEKLKTHEELIHKSHEDSRLLREQLFQFMAKFSSNHLPPHLDPPLPPPPTT